MEGEADGGGAWDEEKLWDRYSQMVKAIREAVEPSSHGNRQC